MDVTSTIAFWFLNMTLAIMGVPLVMKHVVNPEDYRVMLYLAVHAFHNKEAFYHLHLYTTNKMEHSMQFCIKV